MTLLSVSDSFLCLCPVLVSYAYNYYSFQSGLGKLIPNSTLTSTYNEVTFNEKLAIMKENLHTKYFPLTYNDVTLNEKPPIMKENLCIFFFIMGGVKCMLLLLSSLAFLNVICPPCSVRCSQSIVCCIYLDCKCIGQI